MLNEAELEELRMALAECKQRRAAITENAFTVSGGKIIVIPGSSTGREERGKCGA